MYFLLGNYCYAFSTPPNPKPSVKEFVKDRIIEHASRKNILKFFNEFRTSEIHNIQM